MRLKILQAGMPKSGNYWLYKILTSIGEHAGLEKRSFIQGQPIYKQAKTWELSHSDQADIDVLDIEPEGTYFRIGPRYRKPIQDLDAYLDQCTLVWTHSPFSPPAGSVLPQFDRIVYILRDPRDVALSMARFVFTPYMLSYRPQQEANPEAYLNAHLEPFLRKWVSHVAGYLQIGEKFDIHIVFYERLLHVFRPELGELLGYLGVDLKPAAITKISQAVDFTTMKAENPHHVRRGRSGEWATQLTAAQKQRSLEIAGPLLDLLGYPLTDRDEAGGTGLSAMPTLPRDVDPQQLDEIIVHNRKRPFGESLRRGYRFMTSRRPVREKLERLISPFTRR